MKGTVKSYSDESGTGWIEAEDDGPDIYVTRIIIKASGWETLLAGEFIEVSSDDTEVEEDGKTTMRRLAVQVKRLDTRIKGKVKWYRNDKGYGFLTGQDGTDAVIRQSVLTANGYRTLIRDEPVEFEVELEEKGPKVISVKRLDETFGATDGSAPSEGEDALKEVFTGVVSYYQERDEYGWITSSKLDGDVHFKPEDLRPASRRCDGDNILRFLHDEPLEFGLKRDESGYRRDQKGRYTAAWVDTPANRLRGTNQEGNWSRLWPD